MKTLDAPSIVLRHVWANEQIISDEQDENGFKKENSTIWLTEILKGA